MTKIRKVLVVGGGASGWMAAALISRKARNIEVALLESADVPILGVGESTNTTVKYYLKELGLDERDFMRSCDSAFKLAIKFNNFAEEGQSFYHPFGPSGVAEEAHFQPRADSKARDAAIQKADRLFSRQCTYSYQVDAGLFAQYLRRDCERDRRVLHIVDQMTGTSMTEDGRIRSVQTRDHGSLEADLFVDCTGFRSLLLGGALGETFHDYGHSLLNDRAIAGRLPYVNKEQELVTHTCCTALSAGWVWSIPLWSRIGTGYVYSSQFLSPEAAEQELRSHLGARRTSDCDFKEIRIRVGRHDRAWVTNCVAIGAAYGFLEPLESTGLSLTQVAIRDLSEALMSGLTYETEREMFNLRQSSFFDSTRDFIIAHFLLSKRADSDYWLFVRSQAHVPDSLLEILTDARARSYRRVTDNPQMFYGAGSWNAILSGMGFFGTGHLNDDLNLVHCDPLRASSHLQSLEHDIHNACEMAQYVKSEELSTPTCAVSKTFERWHPTT